MATRATSHSGKKLPNVSKQGSLGTLVSPTPPSPSKLKADQAYLDKVSGRAKPSNINLFSNAAQPTDSFNNAKTAPFASNTSPDNLKVTAPQSGLTKPMPATTNSIPKAPTGDL